MSTTTVCPLVLVTRMSPRPRYVDWLWYLLPVSSVNAPVLFRLDGMLPVRKPSGRPVMPAKAMHTRTSVEQSVSQAVVTFAVSKPSGSAALYSVFLWY